MMIRIARRLARGERGLSLVELIVGMGISTLVLALIGTMFVGVARATKTAGDRRQSTSEAQNILDTLTTDIRAGTNITTNTPVTWSIIDASPSTITLITYTDAGPSFGTPFQVKFAVDASGRFMEYRWSPPASTTQFPLTGAPTASRVLGNRVSTFVLTYIYGSCVSGTCNNGDIDAVGISLTTTASASSVPVTINTKIYMPNAGSKQNYAGT